MEELLQKNDIKTMRKDIRQLRKLGIIKKEKEEVKTIQEEARKAMPKEEVKTIQEEARKAMPKEEVQEKEILEKILEEAVKKRHALEQKQFKTVNPTDEPKNSISAVNTEIKDKTESRPIKPSEIKEKEQMRQTPAAVKEELKAEAEAEAEKEKGERRKFMEDIEKWAEENN